MEELLVLLVSPVLLVLFQYFDAAVVLGGVVDATTYEAIEIGASRRTGSSRIPELLLAIDILATIHHTTCAVEDDKQVVGIALMLDQTTNDKAVVDAIGIGCDHVRE